MNKLPWICARRKNVFQMSGKTDDPATGRQTPWGRLEEAGLPTSNADFEQRCFIWRRGVQVETQELRKGDQLFNERDRELAEVSSQLAELQTLFDEVNHQ